MRVTNRFIVRLSGFSRGRRPLSTMSSGARFSSVVFKALFFFSVLFFVTRLPPSHASQPSAYSVCIALVSIDRRHRYSRGTYLRLNIHDSPNFTILIPKVPPPHTHTHTHTLPRKLNEWWVWALCVVGASPRPPPRPPPPGRPLKLRVQGTSNFDPSRRRRLLTPSSDASYARGGERGRGMGGGVVCVLSGYLTDMWRKGRDRGERERDKQKHASVKNKKVPHAYACVKLQASGMKRSREWLSECKKEEEEEEEEVKTSRFMLCERGEDC